MGEGVRLSDLDQTYLNSLLEKAAEEGAKNALRSIGLGDEDAGKDVIDLRNLLNGWRAFKDESWRTVVRWSTLLLLAAIAFAVGVKTGVINIKQG